MWCTNCDKAVSFQGIVKEVIRGLASILTVRCSFCDSIEEIHTSKIYRSEQSNRGRHVINAKLAAGLY